VVAISARKPPVRGNRTGSARVFSACSGVVETTVARIGYELLRLATLTTSENFGYYTVLDCPHVGTIHRGFITDSSPTGRVRPGRGPTTQTAGRRPLVFLSQPRPPIPFSAYPSHRWPGLLGPPAARATRAAGSCAWRPRCRPRPRRSRPCRGPPSSRRSTRCPPWRTTLSGPPRPLGRTPPR
jgi:hypothetical protein